MAIHGAVPLKVRSGGAFGSEGAGEELGWGQAAEAEAQPTRCSEGSWSWWQALLPPWPSPWPLLPGHHFMR